MPPCTHGPLGSRLFTRSSDVSVHRVGDHYSSSPKPRHLNRLFLSRCALIREIVDVARRCHVAMALMLLLLLVILIRRFVILIIYFVGQAVGSSPWPSGGSGPGLGQKDSCRTAGPSGEYSSRARISSGTSTKPVGSLH